MTLSDHLNNIKYRIQQRENMFRYVIKVQARNRKINFIDNDFFPNRGETDDLEDDNWYSLKGLFLEKYNLNDDDYEFLYDDIESICWGQEITCKDEFDEEKNAFLKEAKAKFNKIFPDGEEFIKNFKLYIFESYFEDPDNLFKFEITLLRDYINDYKSELRLKYSENVISSLENL